MSIQWRKMLSTSAEWIKILFYEVCVRPPRPEQADDGSCLDRLRAMTLVTMYWPVLVELEASMHVPLPEHWEWGRYLCTSMLEFCLRMEWLLLMLSMRYRNHVPRSMNQVEQFPYLYIRKEMFYKTVLYFCLSTVIWSLCLVLDLPMIVLPPHSFCVHLKESCYHSCMTHTTILLISPDFLVLFQASAFV
jgi:hypothetical protein